MAKWPAISWFPFSDKDMRVSLELTTNYHQSKDLNLFLARGWGAAMVWFMLKRLCLDSKWLHVPFPDHGRAVVVFVPLPSFN